MQGTGKPKPRRTSKYGEAEAGPRDAAVGNFNSEQYGGYGEMVITEVCGTSSTGSIPVSHPMKTCLFGLFWPHGAPIFLHRRGLPTHQKNFPRSTKLASNKQVLHLASKFFLL